MFKSIARLINKRPRSVVIVMLTFMFFAGGFGSGVVDRLTSGGFDDVNSDSYKAAQRLTDDFKQESSNLLLLVTAKNGDVDDPAVMEAVAALENDLRLTEHVKNVFSYWSVGGAPTLKSIDSSQALIIGTIEGNENQLSDRVHVISEEFTTETDTLRVGVGGSAEINRLLNEQIEKDLQKAELIAIPITLIILVLVFRSLVAASLPILIGIFSILGSLFVLAIMNLFSDVSVYAMNLTTMLGLGLAIDYSLFIVSRFREQLASGNSVEKAIASTVQHAGKTVLFSALTVAVSLAALLVFPQVFLRSFAFAGVAVSIVAAIGSLFLLPAILRLLGPRINRLSVGRPVRYEKGSRFWHNVATVVMRRPIPIATAVIALLLFLGVPFLSIYLGRSDERGLPPSNPVRMVHDDLRRNFSSNETNALPVVSADATPVDIAAVSDYAAELSQLEGVDHVQSAAGIYQDGELVGPSLNNSQLQEGVGTWLSVVPNIEPISPAGEQLTRDIRAVPAPFPVYVGGGAAFLTDLKQSIVDQLPLALAWIGIATFILLFLMFGSLLVPLKALIINVLSVSAVFGILVWIFQYGHLSGLLGFTPTGSIEATMPILIFCVAFGLSMDYEVFLLSRIKERYDKTGKNTESVAFGLEKTGGIVTAAAISISIVFLAFGTSQVTVIKLVGLGLAIAVLLDAFIIRGTLVPTFMRLAGRANWWAPKSLKRLQERIGLHE